jgi:hypothetical protein
MPLLKAGTVFSGVRALLNDQDNTVFTNTVQLEYYKMAFQELLEECEDHNIPITNKTSDEIEITAGVTDVGGSTGPALPGDLIEIIEMYERTYGTTNNYALMRPVRFLPKTEVQTSYLEVWQWAEQQVNLLGATASVGVKFDYIAATIGDDVNENSIVQLTNAINFLKYKTGALVAMFVGENETRAAVLEAEATKALDRVLGIKIKSQQGMVTRRRPFMSRYKLNGGNYGR